jgi:hypothetical protein
MHSKVLLENLREKITWTIIKWILGKMGGKAWTGCNWLRGEISGGIF